MFRDSANIIPQEFRRRGVTVAATILVRAVLNFFGIALLVPLLMLILDGGAIAEHPTLVRIYEAAGCDSPEQFAVLAAMGVVAAIALKGVVGLLLYRYERNYVYDLYRNLSRRLYVSYYRRGLEFVKRNNSTELSRNVNFVCLNFVTGVLRPMASIVGESLLFVLIMAAVALYDYTSALLLAAVFIPFVTLYYRIVRRRMNDYGKIENEAQRRKFRNVAESFRGYADVEINNAFGRMLDDFDDSTRSLVQMRKRDAMMSAVPQTLTETAIAVGMAALVVAGTFVPQNDVRIVFGLFAIAGVRLMPSVRSILSSLTAIRYNRYTVDILADMDAAPAADQSSARLHMRRGMELRGVRFGYGDEADSAGDVIEDFSFTICRGERIGIKGASGAGKSTLMNLMLGLYSPRHGEILVDGVPLDARNRRMWQNAVGYVPQSVFLLDSTLAQNIAMGERPEAIDLDRVHEVLALANLTEFVRALPDGVMTAIGESGCRVSGGERQRIGIARALYRRPDVLFFDEATSALDLATERSVNSSIERLSKADKELTIVVIAHRETSLGYCDRIIEIENRHE